jgi:hypothetical protein
MSKHADHHYSVTLRTDDMAVLNCLRSLADFSQKEGNKRIAWGGTTDAAWRNNANSVTFRFTRPVYRDGFLMEIARLLPAELFQVTKQSDNDPAVPQGQMISKP